MISKTLNLAFKSLIIKVLLLSSAFAHAAGIVNFVDGNVVINNSNNELHAAKVGDVINEGDTIVTGKDGEVHIITDDKGLIAVRKQTQLKFDTYQANGNEDDAIVLKLLRGTFRSVTGWVGKSRPKRYQVRTATATIGIRGTDHEPLVIENGANAGTYDKVNSGATLLDSAFGKVDIAAKQVGFVPKSASTPPKLLDAIPKVYQPSSNESLIQQQIAPLQQQQEEHMQTQQSHALTQGGGVMADNNAMPQRAKIGDFADHQNAVNALEGLFRQYEAGNINAVRNHLDPSMIGFQRLLDGMMAESNECKQMRIRLFNTQTQVGPDVAVIQANWEKRCLLLPSFKPNIATGFTTFLMHKETHKEKFKWGVAAFSNDNPFASYRGLGAGKGTLATVSVSSTNSCTTIAGLTTPLSLPFTITVTDPDVTTNTVTVTLTNLQGENETVTLTGSAGTFTRTSLSFVTATPAPSNSVIEMIPTVAAFLSCPALLVKYNDTTTPSGSAQVVQTSVSFP